ncbi:MAG: hypothetical protein IPJ88_11340 [Myxococcales bacterium]|nr:MAG: hypothetical protein IPJ88_11340 [Myxococcales bacterium]
MQRLRVTTRWIKNFILITLLSGIGASFASAQEVQVTGPLAGAPACKGCRIFRESRLSIEPFAGFTLQDEFSRTIMFGGKLGFAFTDWIGLGLWGAFAPVHIDTALTDQVSKRGQSTSRNRLSLPNAGDFKKQIGEINWAAGLEVNFIPLRGKLALFQKLFLDTDFSVFAGVALVGITERANVNENGGTVCLASGAVELDENDPCRQSQRQRASRTAVAPTFGVQLTMYASEFMGLTLGWRALPFSWNTSGTDEGGRDENGNLGGGDFPDGRIDSEDRIFHFNHMFTAGLIFFLPVEAARSE